MLIRRKKTIPPQLNTTATADISFMLLTFFLVTTSMDADNAIMRKLPPIDKETTEETVRHAKKGGTMAVAINSDNTVTIDGKPTHTDEVWTEVCAFILKNGARHLISIDTHPQANYNTYFAVEDAVMKAYATARDKIGLKTYGKVFARLNKEQREEVARLCPHRIAETYDTGDSYRERTER